MAKTNYSYEKRSRELEKQKKKEEKRQKKLAQNSDITKEEETPQSIEEPQITKP